MVGALLAGGSGRRMKGAKPTAELSGKPLIAWPAAALGEICDKVAVVCKADTKLPDLDGVERWDEPDEPRHPLTGVIHALEQAGGPVLVCAADMPFVTPDACQTLIERGREGGGHAAVAVTEGRLQPVFGIYVPSALELLREADDGVALSATVESLDPVRVALPPPLIRSVNTPEELAEAEEEIASQ